MPRGKPRSGQFVIELYFPGGGYMKRHSTQNHDVEEWRTAALEHLAEARKVVEGYGRAKQSAETPRGEQGPTIEAYVDTRVSDSPLI